MHAAAATLLMALSVMVGCGDDDGSPADAGPDSGDATPDARPDARMDSGPEDGGPPRDTGPDARMDARPDGDADAGSDAGDAGPDDGGGDAGDGDVDAGCPTRLCAGECCADGEICGPLTGRCVPPCPSDVFCGEDVCCPEGQFCDPVLRVCGTGCPPEATCGGMCCAPGELCDVTSGGCVMACAGGVPPCGDVCCAAGESCDGVRSLCVPACPSARVCAEACCDDAQICGPRSHTCVPTCGTAPPCGPTDACCGFGDRCAYDTCVLDVGPCMADGDCDEDSWCDMGRCTPYGVGPRPSTAPSCEVVAPPGVVAPGLECSWAGSEVGDPFGLFSQVLVTPIVIDLDLDADPTTRRPSIVVVAFNGTRDSSALCGGSPLEYALLRGIDPTRCATEFVIEEHLTATVSPAAADLDGDGRPELVAVDAGGRLVAFHYDATARTWGVLWRATNGLGAPSAPLAGSCHWGGIAVADMNDDGVPEVLLGGLVYRGDTGLQLGEGPALLGTTANGLGPIVADVDRDGRQELVTGTSVWELTDTGLVRETWSPAGASEGWVALADFGDYDALGGPDMGYPEVVVVADGTVRVQTLDGRVVFGPIAHPGVAAGFFGGPPAVADLDGDGEPEIAVGGGSRFAVFDPECVGPMSGRCESAGVRWTQPIDDTTSARTSVAVFDFEGDGRAEVAYGDECFVRIWDGRDGDAIFSVAHTSCTWSEGPAVADVDGDGQAEIIVPENAICGVGCPAVDPSFRGQHCATDADCGGGSGSCEAGFCRCTTNADCLGTERVCTRPVPGTPGRGRNVCRTQHTLRTFDGFRVFGDAIGRWSPSRPVWNQHGYAVTNVLDDGRVPRASEVVPSWTTEGGNVFRGQVATLAGPSAPGDAPDLTMRIGANVACGAMRQMVTASLCNRGTAATSSTVSAAFYDALPASAATLRCVARTAAPLAPGECAEVSCDLGASELPTGEVFGAADDDGTGRSGVTECIETNNDSRGVCESS